MWKHKRQLHNEEMSAAVGRARQRRDEEEKKIESERKAAAAEKLRLLDERSGKKKADTVVFSLDMQSLSPFCFGLLFLCHK